MTRDEAYDAMKALLRELLEEAEAVVRSARNTAARKRALERAQRIREVLAAAGEA